MVLLAPFREQSFHQTIYSSCRSLNMGPFFGTDFPKARCADFGRRNSIDLGQLAEQSQRDTALVLSF